MSYHNLRIHKTRINIENFEFTALKGPLGTGHFGYKLDFNGWNDRVLAELAWIPFIRDKYDVQNQNLHAIPAYLKRAEFQPFSLMREARGVIISFSFNSVPL
ncbi:hypothetical protein L596_005882 [Steinernema carpocapsae]|uniref:Uncharacterized protein n=1 Tax=Steinernema carpocapsae TaxID=34508 RepID=A0A4U8V0N8_STECR|nr:hypothetical protein L596_005882 [Steinernema carpocapsae]